MEHYKPMGAESSAAVRTAIGENLAALRRERGLSAAALARRAGVGKATLSEIEAGKRNATVDTLHALTLALEVELGVPLSGVVAPVLTGESIRADLVTRIEDPSGVTELYRVHLLARHAPHRAASAPNLTKTAIVCAGTLVVAGGGSERRIGAGQSATWRAEPHETYAAASVDDVTASLLLRYLRSEDR